MNLAVNGITSAAGVCSQPKNGGESQAAQSEGGLHLLLRIFEGFVQDS